MKRIVFLIAAVSIIILSLTMPVVYAEGENDEKNHSLYLDNSCDLYGWGYNFYGQLGDGSYTNSITPIKIMTDVKAFSIGGNHSLALRNDGSLWVWGSNAFAQLGDGSYNNSASPKKIMDNVISISAGGKHSLAIKEDGSLWAWGSNAFAQLGDGSYNNSVSPKKIMDNVISISAGGNHSLAVKEDGSLWVWGSNAFAQLGDGSYNNSITPKKVLDNVKTVVAGGNHSIAIKNDGSILTWGYNSFGQIGDGTYANKTMPLIITGLKSVEEIEKEEPKIFVAKPNSSTILIDGKEINFESYNIYGFNYFKLRDIAMVLKNSEKSFEVTWDQTKNAVIMTSNLLYTKVGGELSAANDNKEKDAVQNTAELYLNDSKLSIIAYNINGYNYFKLRDIASVIDFGVDWSQESQTISIDTSQAYIAP